MHYIYCYENKINGHKYVGQTNNPKVRYNAHESQSLNKNSKDYNCLFHKKIRQYGLKNFKFYILEEIDSEDSEYIDFREAFWIEQLNTWCRYGKGYNETTGGAQFKKSISINDEEIKKIKKKLIETEESFSNIAKIFNTYEACISRINKGIYGYDKKLNYPLRITKEWKQIPQEIKEQIAMEILNTKIPLKEIAKKYKISYHSINLLNQGKSNLKGDFTYPLRKTNTLSQEQEDIILLGLKQGLKVCEIAKLANVHRDTVSKRKKEYKI